ncbi:MAG: hypothetical protein JW822_07705 [Spirochaetales bacterium]|jgi:hypothetical protein|nr:hypothetical protein [Spirochaetales bacterium]
MSHRKKDDQFKKTKNKEQNIKQLLKIEGRITHGTRGKPTRGARGNKKY